MVSKRKKGKEILVNSGDGEVWTGNRLPSSPLEESKTKFYWFVGGFAMTIPFETP